MDKGTGKKRIWLWVLSVPLLAVLLTLGVLYLAGSATRSKPDDARAIVAAYDPAAFTGLTVSPEGRATLRLEKNDLYWFGTRYGIFDRLLEKSTAGETLPDTQFSFRLDNGGLTVTMHRRLLGLIPVSYKIKAVAASMGTVITLTPREVVLDDALTLPESWWPESLCHSYTLDFADCNISDAITAVRLSGNALIIETEGLAGIVEGTLTPDEELLTLFSRYGCGTSDSFGLFRWLEERRGGEVSVEEAVELVCASRDARAAMAELLAGCTEESCSRLCEQRSPFFREYILKPLLKLREPRRAELFAAFEAEAQRYTKLLTAVREMYRAGRMTFREDLWLDSGSGEPIELGKLSSLSVSNVDGRIVLLTADVGSGSEICTADMPEFKRIPLYRPSHGKGMDMEHVYDLGIVMTTEGGENVLLHFRQNGEPAMTPLDTDTFIGLLVAERQPVVDVGKLTGE